MAYVCNKLIQNVCIEWVEYQAVSWLDTFAISKQEMYMLMGAILSIYSVIIAFVAFNNFMKRA